MNIKQGFSRGENTPQLKNSITDLTGRRVYKKDYSTDVFETNADISFLPASTYFVNISTPNNNYNLKFVIVK
ncbi:MAG: hypothetical protein COX07_05950 [Bacteroidetes bacterium CG23_combo_of_CG06-09_8_20_14_all_32_9]|nr:MAG: hypothetical protein COX07_05950 [Bacteroidetes bacterium CG23_combo_of_CG06-09_8_20_14_all_32_9]